MKGTLYLVATPIGNLGDLSPRAVDVLAAVDVVAAEDTRRTRKLLSAAGVGNRLVSFHRDNERAQWRRLIDELEAGHDVALVSDAGMPLVADPGEDLVRRAADAGVDVVVVPGPSAVVAALAVSGLPTGRFVFEAFLPRKDGERRRRLETLAGEERTMVFLESPNRVGATLAAMADVFGGDRRVAVCRELTKVHEEVWRGSLTAAAARFAGTLGEVVLVVAGADRVEGSGVDDDALAAFLADRLAAGDRVKEAARCAVTELGVAKNRAYDVALGLSRETTPGP
ncbi:MAG: 16S rRNA (cytidine(1402)-2'-O)-methyltransferase [Acidimicrobiia bacterium]|nr:16S rRNA (cytidine(1402)-2'-O)-methyltransferase [Acidimicrobiia bacterium]